MKKQTISLTLTRIPENIDTITINHKSFYFSEKGIHRRLRNQSSWTLIKEKGIESIVKSIVEKTEGLAYSEGNTIIIPKETQACESLTGNNDVWMEN